MLRRIAPAALVVSGLVVFGVATPAPAEAFSDSSPHAASIGKKSDECKSSCVVDANKEINKCSEDFTHCMESCKVCKGPKCDDPCRKKCSGALEYCIGPTKRKIKECIDACQEK